MRKGRGGLQPSGWKGRGMRKKVTIITGAGFRSRPDLGRLRLLRTSFFLHILCSVKICLKKLVTLVYIVASLFPTLEKISKKVMNNNLRAL